MVIPRTDLEMFDRACSEYDDRWSLFDQVLYDLCERFPRHASRNAVNAKLQIVGRAYGTGIERAIRSNGTQGNSFAVLGDHIFTHAGIVDGIIGGLADVVEPLNPEGLRRIITSHGEFIDLLKQVTRRTSSKGEKQSPRAFASKYLHFHNPAVPIYDSYAAAALRKLRRWRHAFHLFEAPDKSDAEYGRFALRFWQLYQDIRTARPDATVKHVDAYLLVAAGGAADGMSPSR